MKTKAYLVFSASIFALVALVHLVRFLEGWSAQIGTWVVPGYLSLICVLGAGSLAAWGALLARRFGRL
jgi:hypothetical protein